MKPSSRLALVAALMLSAGSLILYTRTQDTPAPRLTPRTVEEMLVRVAQAVRRRDVNGALEVTTESAVLFGERRQRFEYLARRALREAAPGRVEITWSNLLVRDHGETGTAEFDVAAGERLDGTDAVYFEARVTLSLRKIRKPRWMGLGTQELWLVERAQSSRDAF